MDTKFFGRHQPGGIFSIVDRELFPTGNIWWVGSAESAASDAAGNGVNPDAPFATLAYAIAAAAAGDTIFLMPNHNENIGNEQIDVNLEGLKIIGLGNGTNRPRFDFDHANASIDITASNCVLKNIRLLPSVTDVLIAIDINAGVTDTQLLDLDAMDGEDGAGTDEFAATIALKAGCDRTLIERLNATTHASAAGAVRCIHLNGASDCVTIRNCTIRGTYSTACIEGDTTLSTRLLLLNNLLQPKDTEPGVELLTGTTGMAAGNYIWTDLATKAAALVGDAMYWFENYYCEVANETGGIIGTASADD